MSTSDVINKLQWKKKRLHIKCFLFAAASKMSKQTTLQFKPVTKKPKKNPWSDEEEEDEGLSGSEMEVEEVVAPRERIERKTKGECA